MGDEARRRRRDSRRNGWRIVLHGNSTSAVSFTPEDLPAATATIWTRVGVVWPRQLHRQLEERWSYAPSQVLLRLLLLLALLVLVGLLGGSGVLLALATGNTALDGFTVGVVALFLPLALVLAYLMWGELIDWWIRRRQ